MMTEHPITPLPELVQQWKAGLPTGVFDGYRFSQRETDLCIKAARWGADQELEACISLMLEKGWMNQSFADNLRAARRPKPPSLKAQALEALDSFEGFTGSLEEVDIIRRALEALPDE